MHAIWDWGITIILWLQGTFSPDLDGIINAISWLGTTECFLFLCAFLYWCVDRRTGARAIGLLYLSTITNTLAKYALNHPRPFTYDPRVKALEEIHDPGLPSGHAQNTLAFWGFLRHVEQRPFLTGLSIVLPLIVGLARIYRGVHFPTDVLGGYLLGLGVLGAYLALEQHLWPLLQRWDAGFQLLASGFVAWLLLISLPANSVALSGSLLGLLAGMVTERRRLHYAAFGSNRQRLLRFTIGIAVALGLRAGLELLSTSEVMAFTSSSMIGFWVTAGAPWLFLKLGLARPENT